MADATLSTRVVDAQTITKPERQSGEKVGAFSGKRLTPSRTQPSGESHQFKSRACSPPLKSPTKKPPLRVAFRAAPTFRLATTVWSKSFTWHRAIFAGGYPPTIVAAAAFHNRVRDGSVWFHSAMDTRIGTIPSLSAWNEFRFCPQVNPENCIGNGNRSPVVNSTSRQPLTVWKSSDVEPSVGQALGLLVLLRFTHYCAST